MELKSPSQSFGQLASTCGRVGRATIVERLSDTYMDISPSRKGLKIWVRGALLPNLPGVAGT